MNGYRMYWLQGYPYSVYTIRGATNDDDYEEIEYIPLSKRPAGVM